MGTKKKNSSIIKKRLRRKMSVFERIKSEIPSGTVFYTPVQRVKFKVYVEADRTVFSVGAKPSLLPVPRDCWDGIPVFLSGRGWVRIGANKGQAPKDSLQEYDDTFHSKGKPSQFEANYVASVLEHLRIVEIDPRRKPFSKIRLL